MQPPCFTACARLAENGDGAFQKLLFKAEGETTEKRHANSTVPTNPQLRLRSLLMDLPLRQTDDVALF